MTAPALPAERSSKVAADRVGLPLGSLVAIVVSTAASVGLAARMLPSNGRDPMIALIGGALAGALAVGLLRSVSVRSTTRWMCVIGAILLLRFGSSDAADAGGIALTLGWVVSTVTALVLAARAERWMWKQAVSTASAIPAPGGRSATGAGRLARIVVVVVSLIGAAGIGLGPVVAGGFVAGARAGESPSFGRGANSALTANQRLDMTRRPRLTDAVVMTVRTDAPGFWRSQTFDEWDGQAWRRSRPDVTTVPPSGVVTPPESDLAATTGATLLQDFRIEASYASSLPVSPSALVITAPSGLVQWDDGSVATTRPLGRGATYRVESRRRTDLTPDVLRAAGPDVPVEIAERYAGTPVATPRVRDLAERITAGADTDYDKVRAIEAWLDANTEYSLDAPLSPRDADVVDDFLFESRLGWCEQIASSLTVLARLSGVPARLAIGYVPEGQDPLTRSYTVRERDAHAWTEVWFAGVGWVPFDPTAGVPLSGAVTSGVVSAVASYGSWVLLTLALVVALGSHVVEAVVALGRGLGSVGARLGRRRDRARTGDDWPSATEAVLERVGERWGRPRAPAETTTSYARDVAARLGDPRLSGVGEVIDRARYAPQPPGPDERAMVTALLDTAADAEVRR